MDSIEARIARLQDLLENPSLSARKREQLMQQVSHLRQSLPTDRVNT